MHRTLLCLLRSLAVGTVCFTPAAQSKPSTASKPMAPELRLRLEQAESEAKVVLAFAQSYLQGEPVRRPQARVAVKIAKAWLDKFADLAGLLPAFAGSSYAEVEAVVRRALPAAGFEQPDTAEDALFHADWLTRLTMKRWREAIAVLDAYLMQDPQNAMVRAMLKSRRHQAQSFLEDHLNAADDSIARGDREALRNMQSRLQFQKQTGGLVEWAEQLDKAIARIEAALAAK